MNTRQIPGRDKIGSLAPGEYKTFEGTEISIENCLKAKVKDLVVEGKTYQNLCIEDTSNEKSSLNFSNYSMFKTETYYTIILEITVDNASQINLAFNNSSQVLISTKGHNKGIYKFKVRNTNTSLGQISSVNILSLKQEGYNTCLFKNVTVLEGDYTNIDLPNSINGIESVSERENNVLSVKINDNTTTLNLPIPLRSLPNGTCDTIEGNKLAQRVGAVLLNGTQDMTLANVNQTLTTRVRIRMDNAKVSKNNLICKWFIRTGAHGDYEYIIIQDSSAGICLFISVLNTKLDTVDLNGIEKYFKENPLIVYYELATPIIHDLEIPSISTTKGTNTITTTNNIKPKLSMKVKVEK